MRLELRCPHIVETEAAMEVVAVHAAPGDMLEIGAALIDFRLDLSAAVAHDCPPVSTYRIALAEPARLEALEVAKGDRIAPGGLLARLAAGDEGPTRAARVTVVAILHFDDWWAEG